MAFKHATAPTGLRNDSVLSADNAIPERHIVISTLRKAAPLLGISATVIATLDAMLSCLAPKRNHHTVFASNATLAFRRNGISDRTLRRHAAALQEIGLLVRNDSPNGKRFSKHSRKDGKALRFGFDLTPLFERLHEIADIAATALREREQINYLRTKIRSAANLVIEQDPNDETALETLRALRRKLSLNDCETLLDKYATTPIKAEGDAETDDLHSTPLSASDGHFVRHHHKSTKETIDKEEVGSEQIKDTDQIQKAITVPELLAGCPEAAQFSPRKIETIQDVIDHARTLAPMIGINDHNYQSAQDRWGPLRTAATVWVMLQLHDKITSVGAYFRSITTGTRSADFNPERLVRRLCAANDYAT